MHSRTPRSLGAALVVFALIAVTSPAQTTKDSKEVKQAFQQGQLDTLVQAQQTLAAAEAAGAPMYAKSIYDDAAERLRFAQANWQSTQKSTHEQTRLRAEEAVWAARAALAKARWLGNNAAIRQLQTDITNFGGTSDALTLSDEQPDLLMMRGTTSKTAVDFAQKAIDQAKAVGASAQQNNDLQSAQDNLETARKIMKGNSNSESAFSQTDMLMAKRGSDVVRMPVALPLSSCRRHTKPGLASASALIRSKAAKKSAVRGSPCGAVSLPTLICARCHGGVAVTAERYRTSTRLSTLGFRRTFSALRRPPIRRGPVLVH